MAYRIGIEVGGSTTAWASVSRDERGAERIDGGTVESVAGVIDGVLVGGADAAEPARLQDVARGFVDRLGESEAIVLAGVPYGVETLVGSVIASVVRTATERLGAAPGAVVLVHEDALDEYRIGLLAEAARVAGVPVADIVTATRSDARGASMSGPPGLETVAGAALLGWARRPAPAPDLPHGVGVTEAGIAATGAAAGAAGGSAVVAGLGDGVATANAAMAPPAGPAGTPLSPAGPTGTPLTPVGPTGTPLTPPAGPTGTPLSPPAGPAGAAGPTGTPLSPPAGPTGTPMTSAAPVAGPEGAPLVPPSTGKGLVPRALRPRRLPIVIGASVVAVAAVAVVAIAVNDDDPPSTAPTAEITEVTDAAASSGTDVAATTTLDTVAAAATASRCIQGTWTMRNDSFAEFFASQFSGTGGLLAATDVSGSVSIAVAEDGTWTVTYDNWTLRATMSDVGAEMTVGIDGVDVAQGTFDDDGTYSFTSVSTGTTVTESATVNGVAIPLPPVDRESQVVGGSGTFTCDGDVVTLFVPASSGSFVMDRTG